MKQKLFITFLAALLTLCSWANGVETSGRIGDADAAGTNYMEVSGSDDDVITADIGHFTYDLMPTGEAVITGWSEEARALTEHICERVPETVSYEGVTYTVTELKATYKKYFPQFWGIPGTVKKIDLRNPSGIRCINYMGTEPPELASNYRNAFVFVPDEGFEAHKAAWGEKVDTMLPVSSFIVFDYISFDDETNVASLNVQTYAPFLTLGRSIHRIAREIGLQLDELTIPGTTTHDGKEYNVFVNSFRRTPVRTLRFGEGVTGIFAISDDFREPYLDGQNYDESTLKSYSSLEEVYLPSTCRNIYPRTFQRCHSLKNVHMQEGLESIGEEAFLHCISLESLHLPASLRNFGESQGWLRSCKDVTIPEENPYYTVKDGVIFDKEMSALVCYPAGLEHETYCIPDGVKTVSWYAFEGATGLKSLTVPASVDSLGRDFLYYTALREIHMKRSVPPLTVMLHGFGAYQDVFSAKGTWLYPDYDMYGECTLYVPAGSKDAYASYAPWSQFANIVEEAGEDTITVSREEALEELDRLIWEIGIVNNQLEERYVSNIPGGYPEDLIFAYVEANDRANDILSHSEDFSYAEIVAASQGLRETYDTLIANRIPLNFAAGNYYLVSAKGPSNVTYTYSDVQDNTSLSAAYGDAETCRALWKMDFDVTVKGTEADPTFIWQIEEAGTTDAGDQLYTIKNLALGQYLNNTTSSSHVYGFTADVAEAGRFSVAFAFDRAGFMTFTNVAVKNANNSLSVSYANDKEIVNWTTQSSLSFWMVVPVDDETIALMHDKIAEIQNGMTQRSLNDTLQYYYDKARIAGRSYLFNGTENGQFATADGLVVNDSQVRICPEDPSEGDIAFLFDSDFKSYAHTSWHTSAPGSEPHFIQLDLGEAVQTLVMKYASRSNSWHKDSPYKVVMYGTNDPNLLTTATDTIPSNEWDKLGTYTLNWQYPLLNNEGDTVAISNRDGIRSVIPEFEGGGVMVFDFPTAYRYVRMSALSTVASVLLGSPRSNGDGFNYWCFSELRAYSGQLNPKCIYANLNAYSKQNLDDCLALALTELNAGKATQSTIDKLKELLIEIDSLSTDVTDETVVLTDVGNGRYTDGTLYYLLDQETNTATVTYINYDEDSEEYNTSEAAYSGNLEVPAKVQYEGATYTVTSIGEYAFANCKNLTGVDLPPTITEVGYCSFNSNGLISIIIPDGVETIGDWTFGYSQALEYVFIPKSVQSIGENCFYACSAMKEIVVEDGNLTYDSRDNCKALIETSTNTLLAGGKDSTIPNTVTTIGIGAFSYRNISSIEIPNSVTQIGDYAFQGCTLEEINLPISLISIGEFAFQSNKFTTVVFPSSLKTIGLAAFNGCPITEVVIPASVESIGGYTFYIDVERIQVESGNSVYDSREDCNAIIETATNKLILACKNTIIPNSVEIIGSVAFSYAFNNKTYGSMTIPSSVKTIEDKAFEDCENLTELNMENGVTTIGNYAFYYCKGLNSLTIPSSVEKIGEGAFYNCTGMEKLSIHSTSIDFKIGPFYQCKGLKEVEVYSSDPEGYDFGDYKSYAFAFVPTSECTLRVPIGSKDAYAATYPWSEFGNIVEFEDIQPLEENEVVDFSEEGGLSEETDLDGSVIGNVFYNISSANGSYSDGCIVVTKPTNDEDVEIPEGSDIFGEDFRNNFTGIVFKVPAGSGTVKITAETTGNTTLKVRIGNNPPIEMELSGKLKASFPYTVSVDSYVYIYAGKTAESTRLLSTETSQNMLKIYSVEWNGNPVPTSISNIESNNGSAVYDLQGRRVTQPRKGGIYVVNGKKVMM